MKRKVFSKPHGVEITNVISHSKLTPPGVTIDTNQIAIALHGRVNDAVFPACVCHCRITRTTQSVFKSGKLVVVGADSEETALMSARLFAYTVRRVLGLDVGVYDFVINNVVGCFSLPYQLNLNLFHEDHELTTQWDPENFKGLSYKPGTNSVSFVLFESGEGILTGGKFTKDLHVAYDANRACLLLYRVGSEYRKQDEHRKRARPWFNHIDP